MKKIISLVLLVFAALLFYRTYFQKPVVIPQKNQTTSGWKEYKNSQYRFSFKYPDGLLSDFEEVTASQIDITLKKLESNNKTKKAVDPTSYNVFFEANGWKFDGSLDQFTKENLLLTNSKRQRIKLGSIDGLRISNLTESADAYYYYNLFKKENYIYNFALFADNAEEVRGNTKLLDEIIGTAKFY